MNDDNDADGEEDNDEEVDDDDDNENRDDDGNLEEGCFYHVHDAAGFCSWGLSMTQVRHTCPFPSISHQSMGQNMTQSFIT